MNSIRTIKFFFQSIEIYWYSIEISQDFLNISWYSKIYRFQRILTWDGFCETFWLKIQRRDTLNNLTSPIFMRFHQTFFTFFFNGYASFMIMFIIDQKKFEDALLGFSSMSAVSQFSASPTS
jgi:hypothetical protein